MYKCLLKIFADWVKIGNKDYLFNTDKKSYLAANNSCFDHGGILFEPRDESVNSEVAEVAVAMGVTRFWFGVNDLDLENSFVYSSSGDQLTWTNWRTGEPNNMNSNEDCGEIYSSSPVWNDFSCNFESQYVCERNNSLILSKW